MPGRKSVEFGADGSTVDGTEGAAPEEVTETPEETEEEENAEQEPAEGAEGEGEEADDEEAPETPPKPEGKYRIGDKFFKTEAEALAYANKQEEAGNPSVLDAYRQGLLDRENANNPNASVTPNPEDEDSVPFDEEKYYENPGKYMQERDRLLLAKATEKATRQINQATTTREQGQAIWNEFSTRHPDLAEFRDETEAYVAANKETLQTMVKDKGRPAALDYIALRMKANFRKYQNLGKPTRVLNNSGGGPSPSGQGRGVTPKPKGEKVMTFAEQIRQNRKVR